MVIEEVITALDNWKQLSMLDKGRIAVLFYMMTEANKVRVLQKRHMSKEELEQNFFNDFF